MCVCVSIIVCVALSEWRSGWVGEWVGGWYSFFGTLRGFHKFFNKRFSNATTLFECRQNFSRVAARKESEEAETTKLKTKRLRRRKNTKSVPQARLQAQGGHDALYMPFCIISLASFPGSYSHEQYRMPFINSFRF